MGSTHSCNSNSKLPSREDVTGVNVKGGVMAKITNGDKFSNWSWWVGVSPGCKSTVFTRLGFHITVWMYIALFNIFYFVTYHKSQKFGYNEGSRTSLSKTLSGMDSFAIRLLTWLLAGFVSQVVFSYYVAVRVKASDMIQGLDSFVDGIIISVDYNSPRAKAFLNDLYGAVRATAYYALAYASENTKFRLPNDRLQDIFDENGYDGEFLTSYPKKQTVTVVRQALLLSLEEEKEASESCLQRYNNFREENIRQSITLFAAGAMSTISCVSSNKLPFAYVHLLTWATRTFLLFGRFFSYVSLALEYETKEVQTVFSCYNSVIFSGAGDGTCYTGEFIVFNIFNLLVLYFVMGLLELYPALMKTWQSQLVLKNYKKIIDDICQPLNSDAQPKNLSRLKKTAIDDEYGETSA
jgi:hypothetical protein